MLYSTRDLSCMYFIVYNVLNSKNKKISKMNHIFKIVGSHRKLFSKCGNFLIKIEKSMLTIYIPYLFIAVVER